MGDPRCSVFLQPVYAVGYMCYATYNLYLISRISILLLISVRKYK